MRRLVQKGWRRDSHLPIGCDHSRHLPITSDHFTVGFVTICPHVTDMKMALPRRDVGLATHRRKGEMPVVPTIKMVSISGAAKVAAAEARHVRTWATTRGCRKGQRGRGGVRAALFGAAVKPPTERGRHTTSPAPHLEDS